MFIFLTELSSQSAPVNVEQGEGRGEAGEAGDCQDQGEVRAGGGGGAELLTQQGGRPGGGVRQAALQAQHQVVAQAAADHVVQEHRGQVGDPFVKLKYQLVSEIISINISAKLCYCYCLPGQSV